jgi:hypothetical protein
MPPLVRAVVSGGQTGVDRAALDAALGLGIPCGGWCPAGRWAEDGRIPSRYPLRETPRADPAQRTLWNVRDADATLILSPRPLRGGTRFTRDCARRLGRPCEVRDPLADGPGPVRRWLLGLGPLVLNVAGPRESELPGAHAASLRWLLDLLGGSRA